MKIALITERADIKLGGAERSIFELAAALRSRGLDVHILAAKGWSKGKNVHLLCQEKWSERTALANFESALKKHLSANHYDIIHSALPLALADVYQPRGGAYPEAIARNAASYQNKFIERYKMGTAWLNHHRTALAAAERRICEQTDGPIVAALSRYMAEQFIRHYGLCDARLRLIHNGVDTNKRIDTIKANKLRRQLLQQIRLTEADKAVFFLFTANNFRLKGLRPLLCAMQMAAAATSQTAYLVVLGNDETRTYQRLAEKLNVRTKIAFLGTIRNVQDALSFCHVAVLPTFYDPCSRFILEALAANKPVITTKFNGATELFVNNRHGRVIDMPENIPALAGAISYFTSAENVQKASAAIIKDSLKEQISITRAARQLNELYQSILEKGRQE